MLFAKIRFHRNCGLIIVTLSLFLEGNTSVAAETPNSLEAKVEAKEIILSPFKTESITTEGPIRGAVVTSSQNEPNVAKFADKPAIWMVGGESLWRWDLASNLLTRIALPRISVEKDSKKSFCCIGSDGVNVFVADQDNLYVLQLLNQKIFKISLPKEKFGEIRAFTGEGDDFWLVFSRGLARFDRYSKTLGTTFITKNSLKEIPYKSKHANVFMIKSHRTLSMLDLSTDKSRITQIFKTSIPILDLQNSGNGLILSTAHSVLRIDYSGNVLQSMPVENRRTLLAMDINPKSHSYLFSDGLLEVYNPINKKIQRYALSLNHPIDIKEIRLTGEFLVLINSSSIRAFSLPPS